MIDIVLPNLNHGRFLRECLTSIRNQNVDKTVYIIDGGSTDNTFEVLKDFPETKIYSFNGRVKEAIEYGLNLGKGEFINCFASDNAMLPNFLEKAEKTLKANPNVGLVYGNAEMIDENGNKRGYCHGGHYSYGRLRSSNFIDFAEGVFRRKCWMELGGKYPDWLVYHPDWWLWLKICKNHDAVDLGFPVIKFRVHGDTFSNHYRRQIDNEFHLIHAKMAAGQL